MGICCTKDPRKAKTVDVVRRAKPYPTITTVTAPSVVSMPTAQVNDHYKVVTQVKSHNILVERPPSREEQPSIILPEDEESVEVVLPQKFVDKREKPGFVPRLAIEGREEAPETQIRAQPGELSDLISISMIPNSPKSPTFGESSHSSSSLSELISEASPVPSLPIQSPTTSASLTKQVQFLSPVKRAAGRPTLLRPLQEKQAQTLKEKSQPADHPPSHSRFPSEASTIKFTQNSEQSPYLRKPTVKTIEAISRTDNGDGTFTLNGLRVWERVEVVSQVKCACYPAQRGEERLLVCEYRKKELRKMLVRKKETALDLVERHIELLSVADCHNIVSLFEVLDNPQKDRLYLILSIEYASSLTQLVPLGEQEAWDVFRMMLRAVEHLHEVLRVVHNEIRPSAFVVDTKGEVKMCWLYSCTPMSPNSNPGKDLFSLVAILFLLLFSKSGDEDDYFEELLSILRSEKIAIPPSCSPALQAFLALALEKRETITLDDLRTDQWCRDGR